MNASPTQPAQLLDEDQSTESRLKVIVYSSDRLVRENIKSVLGRKIASDLPEIEIFEFATQPALFKSLDVERYDLAILDGEAVPGGMGISFQMRDEIKDPPACVLLVARQDDAWMAAWSKAEAVVPYPLDPITFPEVVAETYRNKRDNVKTALSSSLLEPGASSRHPEIED